MNPLLKRLVCLSLVVGSACSIGACAEVEADDVATESEDAVARSLLFPGTTTVGRVTNRFPNIPIIGKEYIGSAALYAASADVLPGKTYRGAILVNPGAVVKSGDQKTFAETLAAKGYIVYVANNGVGDVGKDQGGPARGPIPILTSNIIPELARQLSTDPSKVANLPPAIVAAHRAWNKLGTPKLVAIGHSLGGAVLASAAGRADTGLSRIILVGVDEYLGFPFLSLPDSGKPSPVKIVLARGELDGLAERAKMVELQKKYPNSQVLPDIKGVNHFCFIDGTVGAPGKRQADRPSTLQNTKACVDATIEAIKGQLD